MNTTAIRRPSERLFDCLRRHEGLRLNPYRCPSGIWTVGYGHTDPDFDHSRPITPAKAEEFLQRDVARFATMLNTQCAADGVALTQGQFDALVSFAFNLGMEALRGSTLWRKVKADPYDATIPAEFRRWIYAKGVKLPGLIKRRDEEARIYAGA